MYVLFQEVIFEYSALLAYQNCQTVWTVGKYCGYHINHHHDAEYIFGIENDDHQLYDIALVFPKNTKNNDINGSM